MFRFNYIDNVYTGKQMSEIATMRIKNNDVYSLQFLYDRMHDWFVENGWGGLYDGKVLTGNDGFGETLFRVQDFPNSKNWRIEWRLAKQVSPYIMLYWDIDFNIIGIIPHEIMHKDKKIKLQKADTDMNMRVYLEVDYNKWWSKHWISKIFGSFWKNRLFYPEIDETSDKAYREAYQLQHTIKDYWKFRTWLDEPEFGAVDRPKGLPDYD